jgi:chitodextrinase
MKNLLLLFCAFIILQSASFGQGLEDIIIEAVPVDPTIAATDANLSSNAIVYRFFVDMKPEYTLKTVTGTPADEKGIPHPLIVETTTEFFNHSFAPTTGKGEGILSLLINSGFPAIQYDSYVSVGAAADNRIGVPTSLIDTGYISGTPEATTTSPGLDLTVLANANSSDPLLITGGSWASVSGTRGPVEGDSTIVMIGQFTTDGILSFTLNLQLQNTTPGLEFLEYYTASGEWYIPANIGLGSPRQFQFTGLSGIVGTSITPPEVALTYELADSIRQGDIVMFEATATDADGTVDSVELRVNGIKYAVDHSAPYTFEFDPNNIIGTSQVGAKAITAVAIDNQGAVTTSAPINLLIQTGENSEPTVIITSPTAAASYSVGDVINITADASDVIFDNTHDGVDSVEFFFDGTKIGSDLTEPYTFDYTTTADDRGDSVVIVAVATDNFGATDTSDIVWVSVTGTNQKPSLNFVYPTDGLVLAEGLASLLKVEATDDIYVDSVAFFQDGVKLGAENTRASNIFTFEWTAPDAGTYQLSAIAYDDQLEEGGDTISITTIANNAPLVSITQPLNADTVLVNDVVEIIALAQDTDGTVDSVEFFVNDTKIGSDLDSAFSFSFIASLGANSIFAVATDNAGETDTSDVIGIVAVLPEINPVVEITAPVNNESIFVGTNYIIQANASDSLGTVDSVEFFLDDIKIGADVSAPYILVHNFDVLGNHMVIAKATDNDGLFAYDSVSVHVVIDGTPPNITITDPQDGAKFIQFEPDTIFVEASDDDGLVDSVRFYAGTDYLGTSTVSPFKLAWTPTMLAARVEVIAIAYDNDLLNNSDTVTIEVGVNQAPTATIQTPVANEEFIAGEVINILATAEDTDGDVEFVDIFIGSVKIKTDSIAPYTYDWQTAAAGTYTIKVQATDNLGVTGVQNSINVIVNGNNAPLVSITNPMNNSTYFDTEELSISVNASDTDGEVKSVVMYADDALLGTDTIAPYEFSWLPVIGEHHFVAIAVDNLGKTTVSDTIRITIEEAPNDAPRIIITSPVNNSSFEVGEDITIEAEATDTDGTIASVEFILNSTQLALDTEAPFSTDWTTTEGSYTITAIATDNEGATSDTSVQVSIITHIENNSIAKGIEVYPNPAQDEINIAIDSEIQATLVSYKLFNTVGTLIVSSKPNAKQENYVLNISAFEAGAYYLILNLTDGSILQEKIIIQ